jgi:hypothetical protein
MVFKSVYNVVLNKAEVKSNYTSSSMGEVIYQEKENRTEFWYLTSEAHANIRELTGDKN